MRIIRFESEPLIEVRFLNAGSTAGQFYEDRLPVHHAVVDRLPDGVNAVVATADLQGRERFQEADGGPPRLLGEVLPSRLRAELLPALGIDPADRVGVLLAGDFYTVPALDRRGGTGDVTNVWEAFGDAFAWVAGVAGNHDVFGEDPRRRPRLPSHVRYLDGDAVTLDGLRIGGVGGIIGNPARVQRRLADEYLFALELVLEEGLDVLVCHDGPAGDRDRQRGSTGIREVLAAAAPCLVVRGHVHWDEPLGELDNGGQVLCVDSRVVVLTT